MTLRNRLTILVAALVGGVAVLMGGAVVQVAYLTSVDSVDRTLQTVSDAAAAARNDALTSTLYAASVQQAAVAVALVSATDGATWLRLGDEVSIADSTIKATAADDAVTIEQGSTYRAQSARLADGDSVFLAVNIDSLVDERSRNLRIVFVISLLLALLGAGASRLLVRRDLERIRELTGTADRIAAGELLAELPAAVGVSEVDELAGALRRMLSSLNGAFDELQVSHTQLRTFLGDVSHELRTPLTVVRGYVELLESSDELEPELRERAVARSLSEIERMQSLIADLLLLAEYSEQRQPKQERVDFTELVRDEVIDLMSLQPSRVVTVQLPDDDVTVVGDRRALASACTNIFGNIRRHTPVDAAVLVRLTTDEGVCRLSVDDAGPGLTAEQYAIDLSALERFNRMRSESTGGSGLGLRILATVVRLHGGTLALAPSAMGGLRVEITLPPQPHHVEPRTRNRRIRREMAIYGA